MLSRARVRPRARLVAALSSLEQISRPRHQRIYRPNELAACRTIVRSEWALGNSNEMWLHTLPDGAGSLNGCWPVAIARGLAPGHDLRDGVARDRHGRWRALVLISSRMS